jgi:RimJ/RimL family protein N-acetyltransferase
MKQRSEHDRRIVFLQGKKLYLRPPTKEDIPFFVRWMNDQEITQFLAVYLPITGAGEVEWLDRLQKNNDKDIVLVIVDAKTDKPIGTMGLHRINWKDRTATTGALIGEKSYWGKGYGSEAKMLLLHYAFHSLNLRKICSLVLSFNGRSKAYSEKCGYKVEGVLKEHIFKNGEYWDEIHMAVFKEDWEPLWKEFQKTGKF